MGSYLYTSFCSPVNPDRNQPNRKHIFGFLKSDFLVHYHVNHSQTGLTWVSDPHNSFSSQTWALPSKLSFGIWVSLPQRNLSVMLTYSISHLLLTSEMRALVYTQKSNIALHGGRISATILRPMARLKVTSEATEWLADLLDALFGFQSCSNSVGESVSGIIFTWDHSKWRLCFFRSLIMKLLQMQSSLFQGMA